MLILHDIPYDSAAAFACSNNVLTKLSKWRNICILSLRHEVQNTSLCYALRLELGSSHENQIKMHLRVLGIGSCYKTSHIPFFESETYQSCLPTQTKYNGGRTTV
jgi:hypothetical protein